MLKTPKVPVKIAKEMLRRAKLAMANTYPEPHKGYAVCALTDKGNFYEGVSYNSATQTLTMHSEMSALAHAAIHGETNIVAITGPNCHICKQIIWESALNSGIDVQIVIEQNGTIKLVPISELMPYPWPDYP